MDWKYIILIILYYILIGGFFTFFNADVPNNHFNVNTTKNNTVSNEDIEKIPSGGINGIIKVIGFVFIGVGLPDDTATFFKIMFIFWELFVTTTFIFLLIGIIRGV